jgi:hypothetical protein
MECPTKLYYINKDEYSNQRTEDSFLEHLANGGYQVNELAKLYYLEGVQVETSGKEALKETKNLIEKEKSTIFEAAVSFGNYLVRVDILKKSEKKIDIIEVKSKSIDSNNISFISRNGIRSKFKEYIYDVAFQKYVISKAFPEYEVSAHLMLVDKNAECPTEGLNQKFRIITNSRGEKVVKVSNNITKEDLSEKLLVKINVDNECDYVYNDEVSNQVFKGNFSTYLDFLSSHYSKDKKINPIIKKECGTCQFKSTDNGFKNGFKECWVEKLGWKDDDFKDPLVFEIQNYRSIDKLLERNIYKIKDVEKEDIGPEDDLNNELSQKQRQWIQIDSVKRDTKDVFIDKESFRREFESWEYPLHFIDFETSMVAIPFNKGRHPYEGIAFQFSHHTVDEEGKVEHKGQYLNTKPGVFPNYEFIRALKEELETDEGTIFRYATHENTYLNKIYEQLKEENKPMPDKKELMDFIKSISESSQKSDEKWLGNRNMVDMLKLVKSYYYNPLMGGSNSIKAVLPAVLNTSQCLKNKYSKPIYGSNKGIKSYNYKNWKWIEYDKEGNVIDPYKLLPPTFEDISKDEVEKSKVIKDGGAAMSAYIRMQFEDLDDKIKDGIEKALLKYCELDTLAMVMIYEAWREDIR